MSIAHCALCGLSIPSNDTFLWTSKFRAVYTDGDDWNHVRLSGVGTVRGDRARVPREPQYEHDDPDLDPADLITVDLTLRSFVKVITLGPTAQWPSFWGFGFHAACWHILSHLFRPNLGDLLQTCLSFPLRERGILDWGHSYGGAITIKENDGLPMVAPFSYRGANAMSYIRQDPLNLGAILELARASIPKEPPSHEIGNIPASFRRSEVDPFSSLPPELIAAILEYLPSSDVAPMKLASRAFAECPLTEPFWASRFWEGHDFHHAYEVSKSKPNSWRSIYTALRGIGNHRKLLSRKRVWKLALQLRELLDQSTHNCDGDPIHNFFEPVGIYDDRTWQVASRGLAGPVDEFKQGTRALRARVIDIPRDVREVLVSFVQLSLGIFVSGIRFRRQSCEDVRIGYCEPSREVAICIPIGLGIQGWVLAFHEMGVKGISVIMENNTHSPWVGEYQGFPKMRLTAEFRLTALKGEFDAFKLVALSIPAVSGREIPRHETHLWHPEIPPDHIYLNGSDDDFPKTHSRHIPFPFSTVIFGDAQGQDLAELVQIRWSFYIDVISGLEFIYTDPSKNKYFGGRDPFAGTGREKRDNDHVFSIDGPAGELITTIEVQGGQDRVEGMSLKTNFGRKFTFPQNYLRGGSTWTVIEPRGDVIIGFYSVVERGLRNVGLMSVDGSVAQRHPDVRPPGCSIT